MPDHQPSGRDSTSTSVKLWLAVLVVMTSGCKSNPPKETTVDSGLDSGHVTTVDLTANLADARSKARTVMPDPVLKGIYAQYVNPSGVSDLAAYGGSVFYKFISPSQTAKPDTSGAPIGAPVNTDYPTCAVEIAYRPEGSQFVAIVHGRGFDSCGAALADPPSCSVKSVWDEAIRRGAPYNAVATITLDTRNHQPTWDFRIEDLNTGSSRYRTSTPHKVVFQMTLVDRCPIVAAPPVGTPPGPTTTAPPSRP